MAASAHHNLKGRTVGELEKLFAELGQPRFRAVQAFRRINRHLATDLDEFSEFSRELRAELKDLDALPDLAMTHSSLSEDGTEKAIFDAGSYKARAGDEPKQIEAVWIVAPKRRTICISSQVGCTLNCTFCATGTLPFLGNLPTWQILDQVYAFIRHRGEKPTNIVFMGMGEPFHNYENVIRAARILHHPEGLNLGARHITISTAGVVPSIERFIQDREPFNLAISLNHPDPKKRADIMDVNRKYPLDLLLKTARKFTKALDRRVTFEYIMMPGVNLSPNHSRQLIKIARSVRCKVNLIPMNTALAGIRRPTADEAEDFYARLADAGIAVFNRGSPGKDIDAACGMLALKSRGKAGPRPTREQLSTT